VFYFWHVPQDDITVLRAEPNDTPALNALVNSAYRGESSKRGWTTEADLLDGQRTDEEMLLDMMSPSNAFLLKAISSNGLLGCVYLRKDNDRMYLGLLTVSPALQGNGIGKQLLQASEDEARKLNCRAVYMTVITVRKELIDWYVRHGYRKTDERQPFKTGDPRYGIPKQPLEFVVLEKTL
jgi:N-acetylglutamate synthase-like GNAT family acetyltransferase